MEIGQTLRQNVPCTVAHGAEVVVAGGGTAGCLAALAAARNGADVLLLERSGFLGGMMTAGNAGLTMYTVFSSDPAQHNRDLEALRDRPQDVQVAGGIVKELADRLLAEGIGIGTHGQAGSYIFTSAEDFKWLLLEMMEEAGVRLLLHSWVVGVVLEGGALRALVVENKSGRQAVLGRMFVDATGDGDVAARAGVPFAVGVTPADLSVEEGAAIGTMTPMGVMFKAGNVDMARCFRWLEEHPERFHQQPFARLTLEQAREAFARNEMATINLQMDTTPKRFQVYNLPTPGVVTLCCPCWQGNGTEVLDLTRAELTLARMVRRWLQNMRSIPGFEAAFLLDCPTIGVRETRHIQGDYVLRVEDLLERVVFEDRIGRGSHPCDTTPRPKRLHDHGSAYPPGWYFHIPFRSLIAQGKENLLVAGRCISATHEAFGSIRPTVQCMITGEAAGTAAALCVRRGCSTRSMPIPELQRVLTRQGVLL